MKKSISRLSTPVIDCHADQTNPNAVHHNRDRDAREKYDGALPERRIEQIRSEKAEAQKRINVSQSATSLDDLNLVIAKIDDISVEINRDSETS